MKFRLLITFFLLICFKTFAQVVNVNGIIFNEVYYDATTNNSGQWNGVGTNDATLEFFEFYNEGSSIVNLANWVIADGNSFWFQFNSDNRNLNAGESFLVTKEPGSYSPPTNHYVFDVDIVGSLSGTFGGANTGDCLFLINTGLDASVGGNDDIWITFRYSNVAEASSIGLSGSGGTPSGTNNGTEVTSQDVEDQSLVRNPDITGTAWTGHLSLNGTLACSPNKYVDGSTPLPVELSSFFASIVGNNVKLSWRTETEVNNYGFEVQKSEDRSQESEWKIIGFVEGHGNSNSPKEYSFIDDKVTSGKYAYRLKQIDNDGAFEFSKITEIDVDAPLEFELSQNYPNPFNPSTTIKFSTPEAGFVKLSLYNVLGEMVKSIINEHKAAGIHTINFDASGLNSGIYFYKLEINDYLKIKKMSLVR